MGFQVYDSTGQELQKISGTAGGDLTGTYPNPTIASTVGNFGAWASYTPSLTASTTNPNIGSTGTAVGRYVQIGKLVVVHAAITFGGTGISAGSGVYYVSLPVTGGGYVTNAGSATAEDNNAGARQVFTPQIESGNTKVSLWYTGASGYPAATNAAPWTWAASDFIRLQMIYDAA